MLNLNGQFNLQNNICCGDKSLSHRALIFASIADGVSVIRNLSLCNDVMATAECLRKLGADIRLDGTTATVYPIATPTNNAVLDCANSGTTARLLAGLVAGLGVSATFIGDSSLFRRPMDRVLNPLAKMGAKTSAPSGTLFRIDKSNLNGCRIYAEVNSAQVKSAVLIAGLFAQGGTTYVERIPTRNHTELMLARIGGIIEVDGSEITVTECKLRSFNIELPNDTSSAAFSAALALLAGKELSLSNVLLNERRTGFIRILKNSGAHISTVNERETFGEKVGDIVIRKSVLHDLNASEQDVCDAIDEIVALGAIAVATRGKHRFGNVGELRRKESDRVEAILAMAKACGQQATCYGDDLVIDSNGELPCAPEFTSFGDHRVAMSCAVLALVCGGGSVDDAPFEISYPNFLQSLGVKPLKLGLIGENVRESASPLLMRCLARNVGACCSYDAVSLPSNISDGELASVISSFDGLNVTMPFKRRVATLLKSRFNSVNTVGVNIEPQSTDGYGLLQALADNGVDIMNKPLWIVGAGGAAEECVRTLVNCGCKLQIINRTAEHAEALTNLYNLEVSVDNPYGVLSFVPECQFEQSIALPSGVKFVFRAAYRGVSGLKNQAIERGVTYIDGLEMLYHQGAKSFALWTDTETQRDYKRFAEKCRGNK